MARPAYDKNAANAEIARRRTHSGRWDEHYPNNARISYYLFLRRIYGFDATSAWQRVQKSFSTTPPDVTRRSMDP